MTRRSFAPADMVTPEVIRSAPLKADGAVNPIRVAVVTPLLSHFEIPMFRLLATQPDFMVHVFHCDSDENVRYDREHKSIVDWGEDMRAGYPQSYHQTTAELRPALWAWRPNVIMQYGYNWRGALSILIGARLRGIPIVHRGLLSPYINERHGRILSMLWRLARARLLRCFQAHHYGGTYSEAVLRDAGIPENRRYMVPFSVDTPFFAADTEKADAAARAESVIAEAGWSPEAPVLLFICQHSLFKGPDIMLDIVREVQKTNPDVKLLMAGSGAMTAELKHSAQEKLTPGSFHFPGFISSKSTVPFYLAATLVVFPSRYDTWSRAVNEAMIARRPCLVSDRVPAAGGLVEDGVNGYVVRGLVATDYADQINRHLALPPAERSRMGQAARARALEFSYEAHVEDLLHSLTDMVPVR